MMHKLKPCPRCKGTAKLFHSAEIPDYIAVKVFCDDCGLMGIGHENERDAAQWWNTRPEEDFLHKHLRQCVEALELIKQGSENSDDCVYCGGKRTHKIVCPFSIAEKTLAAVRKEVGE